MSESSRKSSEADSLMMRQIQFGKLKTRLKDALMEQSCSIKNVIPVSNLDGSNNIECEMLLTDADFRKIKRLKKRQEEERMMKQMNGSANEQLAVHMPEFNFMEKRNELKNNHYQLRN